MNRIIYILVSINLFLLSQVYGFVIINKQSQPSPNNLCLSSKSNGGNNMPDEIKREEWAKDLIDLGGDPAFLPDGFNDEDEWYDDVDGEEDADFSMPSMSLMGLAGTSSILDKVQNDDNVVIAEEEEDGNNSETDEFEWDGLENEDAYYD